jgi:hypothetical protein
MSSGIEKRYQVFVSSTFKDLVEERQQVFQALLWLDCFPCGMELFPAPARGKSSVGILWILRMLLILIRKEIFGVEVLVRFPEILGFQDDKLEKTYVLPPGAADISIP